MKIPNIEFTKEEMNQAVQDYLMDKGLNVKVTEVTTTGYPVRGYLVTTETEEVKNEAEFV